MITISYLIDKETYNSKNFEDALDRIIFYIPCFLKKRTTLCPIEGTEITITCRKPDVKFVENTFAPFV